MLRAAAARKGGAVGNRHPQEYPQFCHNAGVSLGYCRSGLYVPKHRPNTPNGVCHEAARAHEAETDAAPRVLRSWPPAALDPLEAGLQRPGHRASPRSAWTATSSSSAPRRADPVAAPRRGPAAVRPCRTPVSRSPRSPSTDAAGRRLLVQLRVGGRRVHALRLTGWSSQQLRALSGGGAAVPRSRSAPADGGAARLSRSCFSSTDRACQVLCGVLSCGAWGDLVRWWASSRSIVSTPTKSSAWG